MRRDQTKKAVPAVVKRERPSTSSTRSARPSGPVAVSRGASHHAIIPGAKETIATSERVANPRSSSYTLIIPKTKPEKRCREDTQRKTSRDATERRSPGHVVPVLSPEPKRTGIERMAGVKTSPSERSASRDMNGLSEKAFCESASLHSFQAFSLPGSECVVDRTPPAASWSENVVPERDQKTSASPCEPMGGRQTNHRSADNTTPLHVNDFALRLWYLVLPLTLTFLPLD